MTPDLLPGLDTEELHCFAGHDWTRPKSRGTPKACPEHHKFLADIIGPRFSPPRRVINVWESTAVLDEPDAYVRRWKRVWERTVRILAARAGTFQTVDLEAVEDYVQHKRLAELHRAYAEYDPYQTTVQGSIKPHPGWYQSQVEEKAARQAAIRLGLIDDGGGAPAQDGADMDDFEVYDDQIGPDGKPL
jgi:hypothetical protein